MGKPPPDDVSLQILQIIETLLLSCHDFEDAIYSHAAFPALKPLDVVNYFYLSDVHASTHHCLCRKLTAVSQYEMYTVENS